MLGFELVVLSLVASSNLLHLGDGLVLLQNILVLGLHVFLQSVSLRRQTGHRVSEGLQLRLSRVTAGAGSDAQAAGFRLGPKIRTLPLFQFNTYGMMW